jgi:mono/diheme cytochrome c family protein
MNRKVLLIALLIMVSVLGYTTYTIRTTSPVATESGDVLYQRHCAACHGSNLEGQANWQTQNPDGSWPAPPHDETGHTWHHRDDYLIRTTLYGGASVTGNQLNRMPAFNHVLSDEDAKAIIDYIKSTWSDEIREMQKNGH